MNQERQRGFVGPMQVLNYVQLRTCLSHTPHRVGYALEEIAALLRPRQFQWLRNIRKNSPEARCDLGQFSRVFPHPPTVVIQTRGLSQTALNNLCAGEIG